MGDICELRSCLYILAGAVFTKGPDPRFLGFFFMVRRFPPCLDFLCVDGNGCE